MSKKKRKQAAEPKRQLPDITFPQAAHIVALLVQLFDQASRANKAKKLPAALATTTRKLNKAVEALKTGVNQTVLEKQP